MNKKVNTSTNKYNYAHVPLPVINRIKLASPLATNSVIETSLSQVDLLPLRGEVAG